LIYHFIQYPICGDFTGSTRNLSEVLELIHLPTVLILPLPPSHRRYVVHIRGHCLKWIYW